MSLTNWYFTDKNWNQIEVSRRRERR